jgi:hypothetical protein
MRRPAVALHPVVLLLAAGLAACSSSVTPTPPVDLAAAPVDLAAAPEFATAANADLQQLTWTNYAQAFFTHYCTSCHNPSGQASLQDFNQYDQVTANAATIRCGVAPRGMTQAGCGGNPAAGQFPIGTGPKPSDAERLAIVAWIDAGTPK